MSMPDLNLLVTLDVLLKEGSVVGAARRLQLSASAMSRALARLRELTGDPLLVRAGRELVPTPRALELRERVRQVVDDAEAVLRPALKLDLATLARTFTIRSTEGFVETFGPALLARIGAEAPGVRLWFVPKLDKDSTALREGMVDLETGITSAAMGPEIRTQGLFQDRFVGVVHTGHPLSRGALTSERYAAGDHVLVARRGLEMAPIDRALDTLGLSRRGAVTVGGFGPAIALARASDLIATVPERHTQSLWHGMHRFALPFDVPGFTISLFWHPRLDGDPAHQWIRSLVTTECRGRQDAGSQPHEA
ncbi:LysR family transcriptional regulator [Dokdonella sp.]|uniref:LysR family transcriptional regulator n=1 Tax=Dokdonella sp. TaxID=2291710 RepID=UPI002F42B70C